MLHRSVASLFAGLAALASAPLAAQGNVLLVVADDLGVDKVGCYGAGGAPPTPVLDGLAASGVRFERCWSNPLCSPTRATIQTGRYSFRTGVGTAIPFGPQLKLAERTLAEALKELGSAHATAAFGKWHLGGGPLQKATALNPNSQGYDHYAGALGGAFLGPFGYFGWPRTVDGEMQFSTTYATSANVNDTLLWIGEQTSPWFAYLAFNAPHKPLHAPPSSLHTQDLQGLNPCSDPVPFYDAMVEAMDTELGRLLASLPADVLAATTVIVTADNGTTCDTVLPPGDPAHGKGSLYQGGIHVPLIVSGAAVASPGRVETALVNTSDLFATVIELCGSDPQAQAGGAPADSISLVPYLEQEGQPPLRSYVFAEVFQGGWIAPATSLPQALRSRGPFGGGCGLGAGAVRTSGKTIRNADYKLIRFDDGREELYDLTLDPYETVDLLPSMSPSALRAYAELAAALELLLAS